LQEEEWVLEVQELEEDKRGKGIMEKLKERLLEVLHHSINLCHFHDMLIRKV
jgi:hypothetical protein